MGAPGAGPPMGASNGLGGPFGPNLGKEDFLLMLVTQLNNQDPMNPLEGHEFAAQLAQFSSVEQLIGLNESLSGQGEFFAAMAEAMELSMAAQAEALTALTASFDRSTATSLIGKTVEVPGNGIVHAVEEAPLAYAFELDAPAAGLEVTIRNEAGETVLSFPIGARGAGRHEVTRPSYDANGDPLPPGNYTFSVSATDGDGQPVGVTTLTQAPVERISFGPEGVLVWVMGEAVPLSEIRSIGMPPAAPELETEPVTQPDPESS